MSAFIVSDKTLADVKRLVDIYEQSYTHEQLAQLNVDSVNQRYRESNKIHNIEEEEPSDNILQLLMSLSCFLYQSCEGDCEEKQIFKDLQKIKDSMYPQLSKDPEFNSKQWDRE